VTEIKERKKRRKKEKKARKKKKVQFPGKRGNAGVNTASAASLGCNEDWRDEGPRTKRVRESLIRLLENVGEYPAPIF